jgi:alpha-1,2-mannosyltransferase
MPASSRIAVWIPPDSSGKSLKRLLRTFISNNVSCMLIKKIIFKNSVIVVMSVLILRKLLAGSFFREFLGLALFNRLGGNIYPLYNRFVQCFRESQLFRRRVSIFLVILVLITGVVVLINPLQSGLIGYYYLNPSWAGPWNMTTRERTINLSRMRREYPAKTTNYSILWTGAIFIPISGEYQFTLISDDGSDLSIDHQMVVDNSGLHGIEERTGTLNLTKGFHSIQIRYFQGPGGAELNIHWTQPGKKRESLSSAPLFSAVPKHSTSLLVYRMRQILLPLLLAFWCPLLTLFIITPNISTQTTSEPHVWKNVSLLSLKLAAFFLIAGLALNIILSFFSERTTLDLTRFFVLSPTHDGQDSWRQLHLALKYLAHPQDQSLYAEIFFTQHNKFQYPPTSLLLLQPLMGFSYRTFVFTANILSWLAIIVTTGILTILFSKGLQHHAVPVHPPISERIIRLVLAICFTITFYPLVKSFELGQIQTWIYFFFVLALWAWMSGNKAFAGVFIGIICIIKPQLSLLAIWGLLRKQWRFVIGVGVTAGIFGMISLGLYGWANHADYVHVLSFMAKRGESYYPNQSVNGLLNRMLFNGTNLHGSPHAFAPYNQWVYLGTIVSSLVLIVAALFWKRGQSRPAEMIDFLIAVLSFTIASPIAWEHHYSVLLPMFAVVLPVTLTSKFGQNGILLLAGSFVLSSNFYQIANTLANTHLNFLQSYLFFGAILFLFHLYQLRDA